MIHTTTTVTNSINTLEELNAVNQACDAVSIDDIETVSIPMWADSFALKLQGKIWDTRNQLKRQQNWTLPAFPRVVTHKDTTVW